MSTAHSELPRTVEAGAPHGCKDHRAQPQRPLRWGGNRRIDCVTRSFCGAGWSTTLPSHPRVRKRGGGLSSSHPLAARLRRAGLATPRLKMSFLRGKTAKGMLRTPGSSDSMYQKTVIDNVLLKPYTTLEVNSAP